MVHGWEHLAMQGTNSSTSRRALPGPLPSKFLTGMQEEVTQSAGRKREGPRLKSDDYKQTVRSGFVNIWRVYWLHPGPHCQQSHLNSLRAQGAWPFSLVCWENRQKNRNYKTASKTSYSDISDKRGEKPYFLKSVSSLNMSSSDSLLLSCL